MSKNAFVLCSASLLISFQEENENGTRLRLEVFYAENETGGHINDLFVVPREVVTVLTGSGRALGP